MLSTKNIVLIGFMGVGKSSVAKLLSSRFKRDVISTDEIIVQKAGKPITVIFKDKGEEHFRKLEAGVIKEIAQKKNLIIDCGGGVALNPANIELLKTNGVVFYLSATSEEIYQNVKNQTHRPLLNTPDPKARIEELLAQRRPFYEKADHIIDANGKTGEQLCSEIVTLYGSKI